jgi:hypothetical protein
MDAFWTPEERAFRQIAREHFGRRERLGPPGVPPGLGLGGWAAVIDEAANHDPRLGRELSCPVEGPDLSDRSVEAVLACARLAGTAAHVLAAGAKAAHVHGAFASSLMGCRDIQESLAGLASGAEWLRFGACRLCRLLERGDRLRAEAEAAGLRAKARDFAGDVRAAALSLLGAPWVAENLADEEALSADERIKP